MSSKARGPPVPPVTDQDALTTRYRVRLRLVPHRVLNYILLGKGEVDAVGFSYTVRGIYAQRTLKSHRLS
jgi:hypothetical protein